ncbi:YihY/virulence factor BrkB family protein [Bacillus sp. V5-8f]|uniref:YihY/virulence factor BrkB family protein n=1 Tax=Bacillus sp. V5-8f TaxID=2053044 RepID=UPI000C7814F0|nr:YihY/virulence factor BrkB family protein [Bacillus sp. V5-8f]PLT32961.1 ribonuclease [Bacillus sp. V5-8f]
MNKLISFGKMLGQEIKEDRATGLAAEQAYYYMLALFPMLILLLSIVPYLSIEPQKAIDFIGTVMPAETSDVFKDNIITIVSDRNGGLLTFGILGTLWSASNGMNAFIHSMNIAFDVDETRSFIKARLLSIGLTLGLILAFIVALSLPVFGKIILDLINKIVSIPESMQILFSILRWVVAIVVIAFVLAMMYRFAPNKHYPFKQVIPGAVAATVIWQIISLGFSFYVSHFGNYSSTYGSLGGVIVLMLWLYLTGLALVIGGEINALFHRQSTVASKRTSSKTAPIST